MLQAMLPQMQRCPVALRMSSCLMLQMPPLMLQQRRQSLWMSSHQLVQWLPCTKH